MRLGGGVDFMVPASPGFLPGIAVKFLRSGASSANFVLFHELNPLPNGNHNIFSTSLANHVPEKISDITTIAAAKKFCQTGHCITKVGLSNVCSHDQNGEEPLEPIFPFKITLEPTGEVNFQEEKPSSMQEFMDQFDEIVIGAKLFTIKAHQSPDDIDGIVLGDIVTNDKCTSSLYGDTKLFFKHQSIEDDAALKPEWSEAYFNDCYCNGH